MDKSYLIQLTNEVYRLTLLFPKKEPLRYKMRELADDILAKCQRISVTNNSAGDENAFSSSASLRSAQEDIEILDSFFEVAKNQNWVSVAEILKIQEEYGKIKEELKKNPEPERHPAPEAALTESKEKAVEVIYQPAEPQQPQQTEVKSKKISSSFPPSPSRAEQGVRRDEFSSPSRALAKGEEEGLLSSPLRGLVIEKSANARQQKILEILKEKGKAQVWEIKNIFPEITKRTLRRDFRYLLKRGFVERLGERNETFYQIKH